MFQLVLIVLVVLVLGVRLTIQRSWDKRKQVADKLEVDEKAKIRPLLDFDISTTKPHPYRPWTSGKFVMTMGIRKVAEEEWLFLDNRYCPEQQLRRELLANHRNGVMQILPGSEFACAETLETIVHYLTQRYPKLFYHPNGNAEYIYNGITNLTFKITEPYEVPPLEVAAQLVMEDLNLLIQGFGEDPEQHYLAASYTMAPAGWYLQERIGWPLWKIHSPVPFWQEKLRKSIERYFLKMKPDEIIARHNYFIQTNDVLFQQEPFLAELPELPKIDDIKIRHERQTLRRLPKSRAILFAVRTYLTPLLDLQDEPESIKELLGSIREMPAEMAKYKARQVWGSVVENWCEDQLRKVNSIEKDQQTDLAV